MFYKTSFKYVYSSSGSKFEWNLKFFKTLWGFELRMNLQLVFKNKIYKCLTYKHLCWMLTFCITVHPSVFLDNRCTTISPTIWPTISPGDQTALKRLQMMEHFFCTDFCPYSEKHTLIFTIYCVWKCDKFESKILNILEWSFLGNKILLISKITWNLEQNYTS